MAKAHAAVMLNQEEYYSISDRWTEHPSLKWNKRLFEMAFFVSTGYGTVENALRFVVLDDAFRSLFVSLEIGNLSIEADSQKPDRQNPEES